MNLDDSYTQHPAIKMLEDAYNNWEGDEEAWTTLVKRYLFKCAHAIWELIPQEASRKGIEVAEQHLIGLAKDEEFSKAEYKSEGAAFNIDYDSFPADIKKWSENIKNIPEEKLRKMIHPIEAIGYFKLSEILKYAAYFAHFVMIYPNYNSFSKSATFLNIPVDYWVFLSPSILQEILLEK